MKLYLHELGVVSCVDHHSVDPLGVSELSPPQQDLVRAERECASGPSANKPNQEINTEYVNFISLD